jgi:hypothetical protein
MVDHPAVDVWVLWEACEGSWSTIYGVFPSEAEAERARLEELDPHTAQTAFVMRVFMGEVKLDGWWP